MNEEELKKQVADLTRRVYQLEVVCGISNYRNAAEYSEQEKGQTIINEVQSLYSGEYKRLQGSSAESQASGEAVSQDIGKSIFEGVSQNSGKTNTEKPWQTARKTNIESALGKNIMSIAAALLVFVGIVMFAIVVVPEMNDTIKQIMMYVAGFLAVGLGMFFYHRDESNKWYLAVWACGMGALFISLFVSNLYFESFGDIVLYILLMIWTIAMCIMTRHKHIVFMTINQIGICVAIYLAAIEMFGSDDFHRRFFLLLIYFLVTEVVSYVTNMKREYKGNMISLAGITICLLILNVGASDSVWHSYSDIYNRLNPIVVLIADLFPVILSIVYHKVESTGEKVFWSINNSILYIVTCLMIAFWFILDGPFACVIVIISIVLMGITDFFNKNEMVHKVCWKAVLACGMVYAINGSIDYDEQLILSLLLTIAFIYCGFCFKSHFNKIYGIILYFTLCVSDVDEVVLLIATVFVAVSVFVLSYLKNNHYVGYEKPVTYGIFIVSFIRTLSEIIYNAKIENETESVLMALIVTLVNVGVSFIPLAMNWPRQEKQEKSMHVLTYVVNAILIIECLGAMDWGENKLFYTILASVLVTINTLRMVKIWKVAGAIYGAVKYILFIAYTMDVFGAPEYLTSVVLIAFAVIVIIEGFSLEKKYQISYSKLRIPALIAVLICILKLMLFDIAYGDTVLRACSYLMAGLLCFGISYLYNRIDKKFRREEA